MTRGLRAWWCGQFHHGNPGHKRVEDQTIDHLRVIGFWCRRCQRTWTREEYLPVDDVAPRRGPWLWFDHKRFDDEPVAQKAHKETKAVLKKAMGEQRATIRRTQLESEEGLMTGQIDALLNHAAEERE